MTEYRSDTAHLITKSVLPIWHIGTAPIAGLYRGMKAHSTPVNYRKMVETYPHVHDYKEGERDTPSRLGLAVSLAGSSITSAPFWTVGRTTRLVFDTITEAKRTKNRMDSYSEASF